MSGSLLTAHFCAAILIFCIAAGTALHRATAPAAERSFWRLNGWYYYGVITVVATYNDVRVGFLAVGFAATLMSDIPYQAWSARVLGPEILERYSQLCRKPRNRLGYALSTLGSILIRSSPGVLMVIAVPGTHPVWWMGVGVLAAAVPSAVQTLRAAGSDEEETAAREDSLPQPQRSKPRP